MSNQAIFLSAEWRHLVMLNFEVDPYILKPFIPANTELDLWEDKAFVSLVGFMFLNTRLLGVPVPFHRKFEEVNLRFYVKRLCPEGDRRAVVFIKEIVPKRGVAFLARHLYNENYIALPIRHTIKLDSNDIWVNYEWKFNEKWQRIGLHCRGEPTLPLPGSNAEYITEHYWGYVKQRDQGTLEYQVKHPKWRVLKAEAVTLDVDVKNVYGQDFVPFLNQPPTTSFLAEGSEVTVSKGVLL